MSPGSDQTCWCLLWVPGQQLLLFVLVLLYVLVLLVVVLLHVLALHVL